MSDPARDAMPGQSPARLLSASTFNLQMRAARWFRENATELARHTGASGSGTDEMHNRLEVRVRAAADLDQFSVVDLGDPEIDPAASPQNAQNTPVYAATSPPAGGVFAVLPAPIPDGKIGRAIVLGHAVCDLLVNDNGHGYAAPISGDAAKLESADTGPARIIWKAGSSGTQRAVVLLQGDMGTASAGSVSRLFSHSTTVSTSGTGETTLHTQAIASGSTAAGDVIRATYFGGSGIAAATLTLRVKCGSSTFGTVTLTVPAFSSFTWRVDVVITITSANSVRYSIFGRRMSATLTPDENGIVADTTGINYGVSGSDSLILTAQMTAGAADLKHGFGELWGA